MSKKTILTLSFVLSLTVFLFEKISQLSFCYSNYSCFDLLINIGESFLFFSLVFFFSLITYFAPERVFQSWWKFARIAIPVIFLISLAINLEIHHDPQGELQDMYDIPALILLYSIFTIGSIWQIWKGWRRA